MRISTLTVTKLKRLGNMPIRVGKRPLDPRATKLDEEVIYGTGWTQYEGSLCIAQRVVENSNTQTTKVFAPGQWLEVELVEVPT